MVEDYNKGPEFLAIFYTGTAVAFVLVSLRLWIRSRILCKVQMEDWIVAVSMVLVLAALSIMTVSVHYGLGRHTVFLTPEKSSTALKFLWIGFCITPAAESAAKISISLMLMRFTMSARWKWFFYILIVSSIIVTIASLLDVLLSCKPVGLLWDSSLEGHCNNKARTIIIYTQGVTAALYDTCLAISPIILLWKVKINFSRKASLCGLLAIGFFTSIAGIIRTTYSPETVQAKDATYNIMNFLIWKIVELPLSIIVGCLPTLYPLFDRKRRQSNSHGQNQNQNEAFVFTSNQKANSPKIQQATTFSTSTSGTFTDCSLKPDPDNAWEIEDKV